MTPTKPKPMTQDYEISAILGLNSITHGEAFNIAFDYWNTATQNPKLFAFIAAAVRAAGGKVYIITAVGAKRASYNVDEVEQLGIPNDGIHQVVFSKPQEAPQLKADKCVELDVALFIDDRRDICEAVQARGIIACNILKPPRL